MQEKFKEIFDNCGTHIEPLNMEVTMKEIEFLMEKIVYECASVCEEHPSYGGRMLSDLILKKFNMNKNYHSEISSN